MQICIKQIGENFHAIVPDICSSGEPEDILTQWRGARGPQPPPPPREDFLGALKSKGGVKIRNCQCEISYKICKVQLVNRFKVVVILAFL